MGVVPVTSGAVETVTSVAPGLVVTAVSDLTDFLPMESDRANEKIMEDGTATGSDGMVTTFSDLLRVETDDLALMEELAQPLIDMVHTPEKQQSESEKSDHPDDTRAEQQVLRSVISE